MTEIFPFTAFVVFMFLQYYDEPAVNLTKNKGDSINDSAGPLRIDSRLYSGTFNSPVWLSVVLIKYKIINHGDKFSKSN